MPENNPSNKTVKKIAAKTGVVISDKMNKTIVVKMTSVLRHPVYKKVVKRYMKVQAHDEKNTAKVGDLVRIVQVRPISKNKIWKLSEVIKK